MRRALACLGGLTLASGKVYFSETFDEGWESRWETSNWKANPVNPMGTFTTTAGQFAKDSEDQGLQTVEDNRFFSISANYDTFSNEGKTVIFQYQLTYEKEMKCGGGYVKIGPKIEDRKAFGDPTPYNIMFGPDKCGHTKRTHLIFNYKGNNILKKEDLIYKQDGDGMSHLYRVVVKPDNTVRVEIDQEKIYEGKMKEDWELLQSKEILDEEDKKPHDWIDDTMMDDPEDIKPEDWVEDKRIVDEDAKKSDDWDDEEDGEWQVPMKDNPAFKGVWTQKRILNPNYIGFWEAKKTANPQFVDDDAVYKYAEFGFIGFDLWQVNANTIFDNIIITDDKAEADIFAEKWKELSLAEKVNERKSRENALKAAKAIGQKDDDDDDDEENNDDGL